MYSFNLMILICSNSCFELVKSCIAPCDPVSSDYILKGIVTLCSWYVYKYIHMLATK